MNSPVSFGRGRQFELISDTETADTLRSFLDEAEALEWLLNN